ncbi:hypothetical protein QOT17_021788 [Balamuthia mandrillaris]
MAQMEQINAQMAKSEDINTRLISFVSQCLKSPRFGVPPLSTSAPSSSAKASLSPAVVSSSLSSSTDSLPTAGSSSFPPTFTTAKTSMSDLAEQELVALMTTTNGTPSPPALAPTLVDSKAVHGKIKHLQFPTFDGQNVVPFLEQLTMIITLSNCEDHTELWWAEAKTRVASEFMGDAQKWILSKAGHDSLHSWTSFKTALQQTFSLADGTAACATTLKKLMQGNMGVRPFYDRWMTVYNEIYPDANEEVKFDAFREKLSEHNQFLLSIWGCTSLANAVTPLHNHETHETKDNSSPVSLFINHIIKECQTQVVATLKETEKRQLNDDEDSQADASSTSAVITKKSRLELTPVVAAANPTDAHLVNLQATMQKLVEEIKGIKQTQVSVTRNCTRCSRLGHTADVSRPASQRHRFPFHPANLCCNPNALLLPPASHAAPLQLPPDSTSAAHQASSDGAATAARSSYHRQDSLN